MSILEITGQIVLVPPLYENFGKRLVKTPQVYFVDSGLRCHLLDIPDSATLSRSPFRGIVYETFVAADILKQRLHRGRPPGLYYFPDRLGLEVDFLVNQGNDNPALVQVTATRTPTPSDTGPILSLMRSMSGKNVQAFVVHEGPPGQLGLTVLCKGVPAVSRADLHAIL